MDTIEELKRLIPGAVLLPLRRNSKKPISKSWQKLTSEDTQKPSYQKFLRQFTGTGVSLGQVSGGLCTIDLDRDDYAEEFLLANPDLATGLVTKGEKGCNVWVYIFGEYPKYQKFDWGEWRVDKHYTVISGVHPHGFNYHFLSKNPPPTVCFEDIVFPFDEAPMKCNGKVLHNIEFCNRTGEREEKRKDHVPELYQTHIQPFLRALPNTRNDNLVKSVSYLFYQVSPELAFQLGMEIYDRHQSVWNDLRETHEYQCKRLLKSMEEEYAGRLPFNFREKYEQLSEKAKVAFRICRSLQKHGKGRFFLACRELALRLGLEHPAQGQRILQKLEGEKVIKCKKKGNRAKKLGSEYQWILRPEKSVEITQEVKTSTRVLQIFNNEEEYDQACNGRRLVCRHLSSRPDSYLDYEPFLGEILTG